MKARVCVVVALLCVALWGNVVTGQETEPKPTAGDPPAAVDAPAADGADAPAAAGADDAAEPQPEAEGQASTTEKAQTETDEASSSDTENGAALLSASLPSLVVATVLAKVFAH